MSDEFTVFGMTIPRIAILNGAVLTLWGVISYFMQSADPPSITALIPAFMGFPMLALGVLSERNEKNRHHYMHASMALALVMTLGGARIVTGYSDMSTLAIISHLLLLQVGISFMIAGIKSFRHARKLREAAGGSHTEQEKTEMQEELKETKSATVVQNITYNIQDSAISGDIKTTGLKEKDD